MNNNDFELNIMCLNAICDKCIQSEWLEKYLSLYKRCSVQPEGRPSISLAFHQGEYFEGIDEFVTKYSNLIDPTKQWTDEDYMNLTEDDI